MDAEEWNAAAQWVIAGIALFAAGVAIVQARGANRDARQAHRVADESRASFERIANALEAQGKGIDVPPVTFSIESRGRDCYVLRNLGPQTATNVRVDPFPDALVSGELADNGLQLAPMQSTQFLVAPSMGDDPINELSVRCDEIAGPAILPLP